MNTCIHSMNRKRTSKPQNMEGSGKSPFKTTTDLNWIHMIYSNSLSSDVAYKINYIHNLFSRVHSLIDLVHVC